MKGANGAASPGQHSQRKLLPTTAVKQALLDRDTLRKLKISSTTLKFLQPETESLFVQWSGQHNVHPVRLCMLLLLTLQQAVQHLLAAYKPALFQILSQHALLPGSPFYCLALVLSWTRMSFGWGERTGLLGETAVLLAQVVHEWNCLRPSSTSMPRVEYWLTSFFTHVFFNLGYFSVGLSSTCWMAAAMAAGVRTSAWLWLILSRLTNAEWKVALLFWATAFCCLTISLAYACERSRRKAFWRELFHVQKAVRSVGEQEALCAVVGRTCLGIRDPLRVIMDTCELVEGMRESVDGQRQGQAPSNRMQEVLEAWGDDGAFALDGMETMSYCAQLCAKEADKLSSGYGALHPRRSAQRVGIRDLAADVVEQTRGFQTQVNVTCVVEAQVPPVVELDLARVREICFFGLLNAISRCQGKVCLRMAWMTPERQAAKPGLRVEIMDDGEGEENAAKLGLQAVHKIVTEMAAEFGSGEAPQPGFTHLFWCCVRVGDGPTNTSSLLLGSDDASDKLAEEVKECSATSASAEPPPRDGKPPDLEQNASFRVLLVDDDPIVALVGTTMLSELGYTSVRTLEDGDLIDHMCRDSPVDDNADLILLDVVMQRTNGMDVCMQLRKDGARLPIIAMTANLDEPDLMLYRRSGFSGVLPKPFESHELLRVLDMAKMTKSDRH